MDVTVSYCIVNTEQRALLLRCLDAVARDRATLPFATEVLVLDNASRDGSAGAARAHPTVDDLVRLEQRRGKGANDTLLLQRARGRYCLLLDRGRGAAPRRDRGARRRAGLRRARGRRRRRAAERRRPAPAFGVALPDPVGGAADRARAAPLDRRAEPRFVYSDEVDFCKRLDDDGWTVLFAPGAQAVHHERIGAGTVSERRIVELSRNRDRYMRKHHGAAAAFAVRCLTAWTYAVRSVFAVATPGHDPRRYRRHVTATLFPDRGEGLSEAAADFNRGTRL